VAAQAGVEGVQGGGVQLVGSDLGEQFGLDLPGLLHGGPALTGDLAG
jgi:hypothetical protein